MVAFESFAQLDAREARYNHARKAWDEALGNHKPIPPWCVEEMWATCFGPAKPPKPEGMFP